MGPTIHRLNIAVFETSKKDTIERLRVTNVAEGIQRWQQNGRIRLGMTQTACHHYSHSISYRDDDTLIDQVVDGENNLEMKPQRPGPYKVHKQITTREFGIVRCVTHRIY
jgi:hypothetical protein